MSRLLRIGFAGAVFALIFSGFLPVGVTGTAQAEPYRLGFTAKELPGEGVEIVSIVPGGPASNLHRPNDPTNSITLTPGDVITAVDGKPVRSLNDYYSAMNAATPGKVRITIRDSSNGQTVDLLTPPAARGAGVGAGMIQAQAAPNASGGTAKLYILKVTDTKAKGGDGKVISGLGIDEDNVLDLFRSSLPKERYRIIKLNEDDVTKENVLAEIRNLPASGFVAGRDILVVYYNGHGAYNLAAADHFMDTSGGRIYFHTDIALNAKQIRARSTLIISDACSVEIMAAPEIGSAGAPPPQEPTSVPPIFASLFFDPPPGVTAISSTMKGQTASCSNRTGSFFTAMVCGNIKAHMDERLQWKDILEQVNGTMRSIHANDTHQVAYIVGDAGGEDPPPRLGAVAEGTATGRQFHGCEVTVVREGYPSLSLHRQGDDSVYALTVHRDVIQKINGEAIADYAEFINACRNSPTKMTLTVYDTQTGQTTEYVATLRNDR